jgi:hypothetical protein
MGMEMSRTSVLRVLGRDRFTRHLDLRRAICGESDSGIIGTIGFVVVLKHLLEEGLIEVGAVDGLEASRLTDKGHRHHLAILDRLRTLSLVESRNRPARGRYPRMSRQTVLEALDTVEFLHDAALIQKFYPAKTAPIGAYSKLDAILKQHLLDDLVEYGKCANGFVGSRLIERGVRERNKKRWRKHNCSLVAKSSDPTPDRPA